MRHVLRGKAYYTVMRKNHTLSHSAKNGKLHFGFTRTFLHSKAPQYFLLEKEKLRKSNF